MSDETKITETKAKEDNKFSTKDLVWVLIGFILGVLAGWLIFTATITDSVKQTSSVEVIESSFDA